MSGWYRRRGKRILDLVGATSGLMILALPMAMIALAIRLQMGRPVLFRQIRPGLHGEPFTILKFRTMTDARDAAGNLRPDGERLTRLGRWLRRTSLDELPELWNVLRGEMSLVGPRPLLAEYLPHYTLEERHRHDVLPGLTGLAQIGGRNTTDWERRLGADLTYVSTCSLSLDLRILLLTLVKVVTGEGVAVDPGTAIPSLAEVRQRRAE